MKPLDHVVSEEPDCTTTLVRCTVAGLEEDSKSVAGISVCAIAAPAPRDRAAQPASIKVFILFMVKLLSL